jgi:two-component system cell cycle response regulator
MVQNPTPRIMIVESYQSNLKSLANHLSSFPIPIQILSATDAQNALAHLQDETVDLVIIDASLRGKMDGFELCRALRSSASTEHLPMILLLSGYFCLERSKGIQAGADLLLHRPVVKEELVKMAQLLLGRKFEQINDAPATAPAIHPLRRLHPVS